MARDFTRRVVSLASIDMAGEPVDHGDALRLTIEDYGLLSQEAALVTPTPDGRYSVVDGRHRIHALLDMGVEEAEVTVVTGASEEDIAVLALIANIHRGNNPAVESRMMKKLSNHGLSHQAIADKLHISRSQVTKRIRLAEHLAPELFKRLERGDIRASAARELSHLSLDEQQGFVDREHVKLKDVREARRLSVVERLPRRAPSAGQRDHWLAGELRHRAATLPDTSKKAVLRAADMLVEEADR